MLSLRHLLDTQEEPLGRQLSVEFRREAWAGGAYWGVPEMLMVSHKLLRLGEYTPSVRELSTWLLGKGAMGIQLVTGISPPANRSATGPIQSVNNIYCASTTPWGARGGGLDSSARNRQCLLSQTWKIDNRSTNGNIGIR